MILDKNMTIDFYINIWERSNVNNKKRQENKMINYKVERDEKNLIFFADSKKFISIFTIFTFLILRIIINKFNTIKNVQKSMVQAKISRMGKIL